MIMFRTENQQKFLYTKLPFGGKKPTKVLNYQLNEDVLCTKVNLACVSFTMIVNPKFSSSSLASTIF